MVTRTQAALEHLDGPGARAVCEAPRQAPPRSRARTATSGRTELGASSNSCQKAVKMHKKCLGPGRRTPNPKVQSTSGHFPGFAEGNLAREGAAQLGSGTGVSGDLQKKRQPQLPTRGYSRRAARAAGRGLEAARALPQRRAGAARPVPAVFGKAAGHRGRSGRAGGLPSPPPGEPGHGSAGRTRATEERLAGTPVHRRRASKLLPELQPARFPTGFTRVAVLHQLLRRLRFPQR